METQVTLLNIWISPGHNFVGRYGMDALTHGVTEVPEVTCHAGRGLEGDRYYDHKPDYKGQVTFFNEAIMHEVMAALQLKQLDGSKFRRNILMRGIDLNTLVGKRFTLGDVELTGSEECSPCFWMDKAIADGALARLVGQGGLRCRIVKSGTLTTGDHTLRILGDCEMPTTDSARKV